MIDHHHTSVCSRQWTITKNWSWSSTFHSLCLDKKSNQHN